MSQQVRTIKDCDPEEQKVWDKPLSIDIYPELDQRHGLSGLQEDKGSDTKHLPYQLTNFSPFRTKLLEEPRSFIITATLTKPSQAITIIVASVGSSNIPPNKLLTKSHPSPRKTLPA